jgi:hypothetical protein
VAEAVAGLRSKATITVLDLPRDGFAAGSERERS